MLWEILTAVGTLGAVCVALFLPMWQNRRHLSVQVATPGGYHFQDKTTSVIVTNSGGKVITIIRVLTTGADGKAAERFEAGNTPTLPDTLRPGDFVSLSFPYISEHFGETKEILVEDSLGKLWKCSHGSIKAALAIHQEKRKALDDMYPSMKKETGKKAKTRRRRS